MLSNEYVDKISHVGQDVVIGAAAVSSVTWIDKIGPWYTAFGMAGGGLLLLLRLWIAWKEIQEFRTKKMKKADEVDDTLSED